MPKSGILVNLMQEESVHVSVLLREVLGLLRPMRGGVYVDGTLGGGGHTEEIARAVEPDGLVIGMDRDVSAIDRTEKRLRALFSTDKEQKDGRFPIRFVHANYRDFAEALDLLDVDRIDGMLLDLGLSSDQLADRNRGFSFDAEGPLDLRFDPTEGETAEELLRRLGEEKIADLIFQFGEERYSRRIARQIVERRQQGTPIRTAADLAALVRRCVPREHRTNVGRSNMGKGIDPATRTFQALRIAVNDELGSLRSVLQAVPERLKPGGVLAVISFHSLEDRIVKNAFRDDSRWDILTKKPIVSSDEEIERNPRARSAKLRGGVLRVS